MRIVTPILSVGDGRFFTRKKRLWLCFLSFVFLQACGSEEGPAGSAPAANSGEAAPRLLWERSLDLPMVSDTAVWAFVRPEGRAGTMLAGLVSGDRATVSLTTCKLDTAGQLSGPEHFELDLRGRGRMVTFDGETLLCVEADRTDDGRFQYHFRGLRAITEWGHFATNGLVRRVVTNPLGYWMAGDYEGALRWDTSAMLPAPEVASMGFIGFRDLFGRIKWARQLGLPLRGQPRDWAETRLLDMVPDPAGYVWTLWQGRGMIESDPRAIFGVNLYDISGVMMKSYTFRFIPPADAAVFLQMVTGSRMAIHALGGVAGDRRHYRLVFDRSGQVVSESEVALEPGFEALVPYLAEGAMYHFGRAADSSRALRKYHLDVEAAR